MRTFLTLVLPAVVCSLLGGFLLGRMSPRMDAAATTRPASTPGFHDLRVNPTSDYVGLIDPDHPEIVSQARKFRSYEEAYRFVSEEIRFAPFVPSGPVNKTLEFRTGSCLGKATLLASIYRAMGLPSEDIRLIMGIVITPDGPADHVWIDLEHQGKCLQQDPSGMLGQFAFHDFTGSRYTDTYVMKESFCFNDRDLAIVSQLNQIRNTGMP